MKTEKLDTANPKLIDSVARSCGEVTVGCANVVGLVDDVMATSVEMRDRRKTLQGVITKLSDDQQRVTASTGEARLLSERARKELHSSTQVIKTSMQDFGDLTDLVVTFGEHISGFAAAMDKVRRVSQAIEVIASTTNMLALNAAIEAHKAGEAGATFAVVAAEVKKLALDTRNATNEISSTIDILSSEAGSFVEKVEESIEKGRGARGNFQKIDETISEISGLVTLVDEQNVGIAKSTGMIRDNVQQVQGVLDHFTDSANHTSINLEAAKSKVTELATLSNTMFDQIVHSGFAAEDRRFVDLAISGKNEIVTIVEDALNNGSLSMEQLFDREHVKIEGSNPVRYNNKFNEFSDLHIRPVLDQYRHHSSEIISSVITSIDGYLPTHLSERSRKPTGDPTHDDKYCRNRRIFMDDVTARAIEKKDRSYIVSVYSFAQTNSEKETAAKNVFVPLYFNEQYWGNFEILYLN